MNKGIILILLIIVLVMPLVSAKLLDNFDFGKTFSSAKGFAVDNFDPKIGGVIGMVAIIGFIAVMIRHRANARAQRMIRESEKSRWGWKLAGAGLKGAWWLGKKPFQAAYYGGKGTIWAGKEGLELLKKYKSKRDEERAMEERLNVAEQQLEKYEYYLVWQADALERNAFKTEEYITNLTHMEQNVIKDLGILLGEFNQIIEYLQSGDRNPQLIARANWIRNRINLVLERVYNIAELIRQQIKRQEEIEGAALVKEKKMKKTTEMKQQLLWREIGEVGQEITTETQAQGMEEEGAAKKTRKAKKKAGKEKKLVQLEFDFEQAKERGIKKAKRKTEEQLKINEEREKALKTIEDVARAIIQYPYPHPFLKDNLQDINNAMKTLLPKKNVVFESAEKIHQLHEGIIKFNRKNLKIETKIKKLRELSDELFNRGIQRMAA